MQLTTEVFQRVMPKQFRGRINQDVMDDINGAFEDPVLLEQYRDNLLSYTHVMREGKFRIQQYLDAVKYVGFKLMGNSNIEAYTKTFPERYQNYVAAKTSQKDIASYVTSYNKNKLVCLIYEQTLIPTHILNADIYQEAINKQASIMNNDEASFKVQSDAANSLLTHLTPPQTKTEIDITIKPDDTLRDLRATTELLVAQQTKMLNDGSVDAKTVAHSSLAVGEEIEDAHYEEV